MANSIKMVLGSDYDSEGLTPSVRRYSYQGKDHFFQIYDLERERFRLSMHTPLDPTNTTYSKNTPEQTINVTEYFIFSIDAPTFERDFLAPDTEADLSIHSTFDPTTDTLIIKMLNHEHLLLIDAFGTAIDDALKPMGLHWATYSYSGVTLNVNGLSKVPDGGWGPRRLPHSTPKRPTMILEVAVAESKARLHKDVDIWLDPARGNANIAISVELNRNRPIITMDKWEWNHNNAQSQRSQHVEIWESGDEVKVTGSPLIVPFHLLFRRNPETPRESDLAIGEKEFQELAKLTWEVQFWDLSS